MISAPIHNDSSDEIVQRVWGSPTCVLLIFAASSAEFAVNPEAHWLFYTGKLPADPIGRFVSTNRYLKRILSAPNEAAYVSVVRTIRGVHAALEYKRAQAIPKEAYLDVLFMNIEYAMRSFEVVFDRPMTMKERNVLLKEFKRLGELMDIPNMPENFPDYTALRNARVASFQSTEWTIQLLKSYRKALGPFRYFLLKIVYGAIVDERVLRLLNIEQGFLSRALRWFFPYMANATFEKWFIGIIAPREMKTALID